MENSPHPDFLISVPACSINFMHLTAKQQNNLMPSLDYICNLLWGLWAVNKMESIRKM